jgi:hypothetical protein
MDKRERKRLVLFFVVRVAHGWWLHNCTVDEGGVTHAPTQRLPARAMSRWRGVPSFLGRKRSRILDCGSNPSNTWSDATFLTTDLGASSRFFHSNHPVSYTKSHYCAVPQPQRQAHKEGTMHSQDPGKAWQPASNGQRQWLLTWYIESSPTAGHPTALPPAPSAAARPSCRS